MEGGPIIILHNSCSAADIDRRVSLFFQLTSALNPQPCGLRWLALLLCDLDHELESWTSNFI